MLALTAVICTRNRPALLARALASLRAQRVAPAALLIVDNAPADQATQLLVHRQFPGVQYVREMRPGLDVARNRALQQSTTPLVAFLDDDALADRSWVEGWQQAFGRYPAVAICTGRIEALAQETAAQALFECNGGFSRGPRPIHLPQDARGRLHGRHAPLIAWAVSVGNGASFAVRREAVLALGGFDEALDRGPALPGGGDLDLFWRVLQAGQELRYEPAVLAWHEHRRELADVAAQLAGHQRALVAFLCKTLGTTQGTTRRHVALFLSWRLGKPWLRLGRRLVGRDPLPARMLARMGCEAFQGLWAYQPEAGR